MKKIFRTGIVSILMVGLLALTGCGGQQADQNAASDKKVLKVGSAIEYPPFEFMDENQKPTGFDIDLMTEIGKDLGYEVEFESSSFDGLVSAIGMDKYDAVISAMTITEDRAESVLFSDRYFESGQYIAVLEGSDIKSEKDLIGKKVGVQQGTTGQQVVEALGIEPKKFETIGDAVNDMKIGGSDAVVADSPTLLYFLKQHPDFDLELISGEFEKEYFGIAFSKDNQELADKVNATLKKFIENGKYQEVYGKWFEGEAPDLE